VSFDGAPLQRLGNRRSAGKKNSSENIKAFQNASVGLNKQLSGQFNNDTNYEIHQ